MTTIPPPPVRRPRDVGLGALLPHLGRLRRLAGKELREVLRDRRTILTLVLMPLLLYPLLAVAFQQFLLSGKVADTAPAYRLGFRSQEEQKALERFLNSGTNVLRRQHAFRPPPKSDAAPAPPHQVSEPTFLGGVFPDVEAAVAHGEVDVGLLLHRIQSSADWQILYREDSARGLDAVRYLQRLGAAANTEFLGRRLRAVGIPQRDPLRLHPVAVPAPGSKRSPMLAALVPLILILMTITGAVYPAIDLTAGERERGTLEILVAAPLPRLSLLFAKYVTVLTVAMLTALVNLGTMAITLAVSGIGPALFGGGGISPLAFVQIFFLLLLFAAFFSAVLLALTSFARSFKEAQAYLIPLMLAALMPGVLSLLPGLYLHGPVVIVPLLNVVLLARDLLDGTADPATAVVVVLTTLLYALAALALAARVFGQEAVLYSQHGSWSDLFRRPSRPRSAAEPSAALLCLALMFPASFLLNGGIGRLANVSLGDRLALLALANVLLFAGFPFLFAWVGRVRLAPALRLAFPGWQPCMAGVVLGLCLWPFAHELLLAARALGVSTLGADRLGRVADLLAQWRREPVAVLVLVVAVAPAVLEELFFRGFLFSALYRANRPGVTILVTAVLFGLFHLVVTDALAVERLLPSTLLGVVLGWMCWRTGSALPGMLLHVTHNSLLVLWAYFEPQLLEGGWELPAEGHLPAVWLLAAGGGSALGARWLYATTRDAPQARSASDGTVSPR